MAVNLQPVSAARVFLTPSAILCLGLPFVFRLLLSWCFYGSTDTQNFLSAMEALLKGGDNLFNYYPPSIFPEALGAMGGLALHLPMTAVFKMSHAVPDLILAAWFYFKLVQKRGGGANRSVAALTIALQLAPSIVLVSHIHGQMDSWSILFTVMAVEFFLREKPGWALVGGLAMIFGVGIKIFPLFLIPCFYLYRPWRLRHLSLFTLGLVVGFAVYFSQRLSDPHLVWTITTNALGYQSQALMGIKGIVWPMLTKLHGGEPPLRLYVIGALAVAYGVAWLRRLDLYRSLLLALLAVMTVSFHMAPQYLLWPTFLLFCVGMYRTAVFYNLGTGALLIFYYYFTPDNSGAYVPLLSLDWLAPTRPHWFDQPYPLQILNHRLRGAGIWLVIAGALVALLVGVFRRRSSALSGAARDNEVQFFSRPGNLWTGVSVTVIGYLITLLMSWPSPIRRAFSNQLTSDYYRTNYFSYGDSYLYEVTVSDAKGSGSGELQYSFSGNDFYGILQNGVPFQGPFVGRSYPSHHAGVFGYQRIIHRLKVDRAEDGSPSSEFKFWILDGHGSIDAYRLPKFNLGPTAVQYRIEGSRLTGAQVAQLFALWRTSPRLPATLAKILEVDYELNPDLRPDDGTLSPEPARGPGGKFSVIEGLWLYLGLWTTLGIILNAWISRD